MRKLLLVALVTVSAGLSPALSQRHVKRISAWGAHLGRSEQGQYYELSFSSLLTNRLGLRVSGLREDGNLGKKAGDYAVYQGRVLLAPQLFQIGEVVYVHLLLGAGGQYEQTNQGRTGELAPNASQPQRFSFGPQAGAEADVFLGNRLSLVATGTKGYQIDPSLIDPWPGYLSAGFRYHFH